MEWNELPIATIKNAIGYSFLDKDLLKQAFTTVRYWYKKTGYEQDLPNYIGNAIIFDEINNLIKTRWLTKQSQINFHQKFYAKWYELMVGLGFDQYQIKLFSNPDQENENQQYFDVANIFPLLICAIYFDQKRKCTNEVKHAVDKILGMKGITNYHA